MNKRIIDLSCVCICLAVMGVILLYPDQVRGKEFLLPAAGVLMVIFLLLALKDNRERPKVPGGDNRGLSSKPGPVTELVLLSEEDRDLMAWDLYGRTAMVIGRDVKDNLVDVDLGKSPYASMVEIEHAVLNFSAGNWYVEDLGSANGISVKKAGDGRLYKLSADTPCRLEQGDCLYVGLNRLLLR